MGIKQVQIEQQTNFEKSLRVLDEAITLLQRIQKREENNKMLIENNI